MEDLIIEEDNLDLYEIYTKYIRSYVSAYNELPQMILKMVCEAKNKAGTEMLELIELIPYIHSGYLQVTAVKDKTSPDQRQDKSDELE